MAAQQHGMTARRGGGGGWVRWPRNNWQADRSADMVGSGGAGGRSTAKMMAAESCTFEEGVAERCSANTIPLGASSVLRESLCKSPQCLQRRDLPSRETSDSKEEEDDEDNK